MEKSGGIFVQKNKDIIFILILMICDMGERRDGDIRGWQESFGRVSGT